MQVFEGRSVYPPPVWMMRQAGRYLPEYRKLREKTPGFLDFCYHRRHVIEATMQPIRRFDFDAAILFSDIFVLPHALGYPVRFDEKRGPVLEAPCHNLIDRLESPFLPARLDVVLDALGELRSGLDETKALIGFCGAPWTLTAYFLAGDGSKITDAVRLRALREADLVTRIINALVQASARYLVAQIDSGADVVQIFESWAGILDEEMRENWSVRPVRQIVSLVRAARPAARIIVFVRGAGARIDMWANEVAPDAFGVDWQVALSDARKLQASVPVQGNLDPMRLAAGGKTLDSAVERILDALGDGPFIFNLGHGIAKFTDPAHVARTVNHVRAYSPSQR